MSASGGKADMQMHVNFGAKDPQDNARRQQARSARREQRDA